MGVLWVVLPMGCITTNNGNATSQLSAIWGSVTEGGINGKIVANAAVEGGRYDDDHCG